ncbi:MAG: ABC-F family ATP-binding cassette domain-containing protein [Bacteroidales bacterium]|nr:ABC-F family ATP-binding cassette domain-containing protein [Bacteroidales bacterium]
MSDAILTVENLSKSYGEKELFSNISFGINAGQKTALIARNGTGKSTLLSILMGEQIPDDGKVTFRNDIRVAYLPQNPTMNPLQSLDSYIYSSENKYLSTVSAYEKALKDIEKEHSKANEDALQHAINRMDATDAWSYENRIKEILFRLDIKDFDKPLGSFSGGERKKIALSKVLIDDTDLLILDEPTNHLDISMIEWLEEFLSKQSLSILMVTHDRYFLDHVCGDILELEKGAMYHYRGTYDYYLEKRAERIATEKAEVEKAKNLYRTELDWMRRMPQARGTKSRARIDAFYELEEKAHRRFDERRAELSVKTERIGGKILEMYNITKSIGGKNLVDDFSYVCKKGEKIGIVGANGIGKSTLLNMITGKLRPDSGRIITGQTIQFGFYTQDGLAEKDDRRVVEIIRDVAEVIKLQDGKELSATQFLRNFGFDDTTQYNYYGNLSGGERRRLYLLKVLIANPNFLILDEPTNDLDIYTLEILERFLLTYQGCLMVVSHDRSFMDNIVDHLFVFEGDGKIRDFPGNYSQYLQKRNSEQREQTLQKKAEKPQYERKRITAKPTYKQQQEYKTLTEELQRLEAEKKELEANLASPEGATADQLAKWSERIGQVLAEIDEKELRWLELDEIIN